MTRLLQAAGEVIVEQGVGQMNCKATATRAGVDKNLVYRYFGGWNGLLEALSAQLLSQISSNLVIERIDPLVAQETYMLAFSRLIRNNPAFGVLLRWQRDHSETQLGQRLTELLNESIHRVAGSDTVDGNMIRLLIAGVTGQASATEPTEQVIRYLFAQLGLVGRVSETVSVSVDSCSETVFTR